MWIPVPNIPNYQWDLFISISFRYTWSTKSSSTFQATSLPLYLVVYSDFMKCYKQGFVASRLPFNQKTFSGQFLYQTNYHNFFANINSLPRFSAKTPAFCNDSWPLFVFVSRHWATCTDLFDLKNNFRNMFFAILGSWGFLLRKYGSRVFKVTSLFFWSCATDELSEWMWKTPLFSFFSPLCLFAKHASGRTVPPTFVFGLRECRFASWNFFGTYELFQKKTKKKDLLFSMLG